jgi:dethiobiotin synthetase
MVPLNQKEFIIDLIKALRCKVILVSRNYLGSINHSLMTARICRQEHLDVAGWIFNDRYLDYEREVSTWSGYPYIGSVPKAQDIEGYFIDQQAALLKESLMRILC